MDSDLEIIIPDAQNCTTHINESKHTARTLPLVLAAVLCAAIFGWSIKANPGPPFVSVALGAIPYLLRPGLH